MDTGSRPPDYSAFWSVIARFLLGLFGWSPEGGVPNLPKCVVVAAPHTSNWDGLILVLMAFALRVRLLWIGKHTLFRPPFGWLMRVFGGVPINRSTTKNAVEQVAQTFNERERMVLVIAPEGTRKKVPHWRTGFYYIAQAANVPLVLGYVDYERKRAGLGPIIQPTGNIEADMEQIRAFYAPIKGRHPERTGPIVLKPEPPQKDA